MGKILLRALKPVRGREMGGGWRAGGGDGQTWGKVDMIHGAHGLEGAVTEHNVTVT